MEPPQPRSGEEERPRRRPAATHHQAARKDATTSAKPCQRSSGNATHASFNHRGTTAGSRVCCDHRQIRRSPRGTEAVPETGPPTGSWFGRRLKVGRLLRKGSGVYELAAGE
jgi:hypothetical protein